MKIIDKPILIAVLAAKSLSADLQNPEIPLADMLEFRADLQTLVTPDILVEQIKQIRAKIDKKILFTLRDTRQGGGYDCSKSERITLYQKVLPLVDAIDMEFINKEVFEALKGQISDNHVLSIISYHNFEFTPALAQLQEIVTQVQSLAADIIKIACMTTQAQDALNLLLLPNLCPTLQIATLAMGQFGPSQRMVAPAYKSLLGYASLGQAVASGQLTVSELRQAWDMIGQ